MGSDRIRVKKSRFFGVTLPNGQQVTPYNVAGSTDSTGQEILPPLVLGGRLYLGTLSTGLAWTGARARIGAASFYGAFGQTPTLTAGSGNGFGTSDPGNGLWGLLSPIHRHALVRGHAWSSASGTFGGTETRHLIRLDTEGVLQRAAASGTTVGLVTPAWALGWCNKVVFAQGAADALVTFSVGSDGTAAHDADRAMAFGASPNGIGAVVEVPGASKALAFGRDLENRNQINQTVDGVTYTALPELAISAGNPLRVVDALAVPAAGANPAVVLVSCILGGASGPPRLLRSVDGGATYTLIALDSAASAAPYGALQDVNGVLFCWAQAAWYYSLDRGLNWVKGAALSGAARADWDASLRCYILHLRVGAVAVLDADMSYIGTLVIPANDQLLLQLSSPSGNSISYASPGVSAATVYIDGVVYGIARAVAGAMCNGVFVYRYDLAMLRLPKAEPGWARLKGGGGYGDFYFYSSGLLNRFPADSTPVQRIAAGATQILGLASAAGALVSALSDSAAGQSVSSEGSTFSGVPRVSVVGAPGLTLDGDTVGGGGGRVFEHATIGGTAWYLVGGNAGGEWRGKVPPGALLVLAIGRGGRLQNRLTGGDGSAVPLLQVPYSAGQDGGALVEWEDWA